MCSSYATSLPGCEARLLSITFPSVNKKAWAPGDPRQATPLFQRVLFLFCAVVCLHVVPLPCVSVLSAGHLGYLVYSEGSEGFTSCPCFLQADPKDQTPRPWAEPTVPLKSFDPASDEPAIFTYIA